MKVTWYCTRQRSRSFSNRYFLGMSTTASSSTEVCDGENLAIILALYWVIYLIVNAVIFAAAMYAIRRCCEAKKETGKRNKGDVAVRPNVSRASSQRSLISSGKHWNAKTSSRWSKPSLKKYLCIFLSFFLFLARMAFPCMCFSLSSSEWMIALACHYHYKTKSPKDTASFSLLERRFHELMISATRTCSKEIDRRCNQRPQCLD